MRSWIVNSANNVIISCNTLLQTLAAWQGLEAALAAGKTRSIGVSNFNASLVRVSFFSSLAVWSFPLMFASHQCLACLLTPTHALSAAAGQAAAKDEDEASCEPMRALDWASHAQSDRRYTEARIRWG